MLSGQHETRNSSIIETTMRWTPPDLARRDTTEHERRQLADLAGSALGERARLAQNVRVDRCWNRQAELVDLRRRPPNGANECDAWVSRPTHFEALALCVARIIACVGAHHVHICKMIKYFLSLITFHTLVVTSMKVEASEWVLFLRPPTC